jgi:hypothetical protein
MASSIEGGSMSVKLQPVDELPGKFRQTLNLATISQVLFLRKNLPVKMREATAVQIRQRF